MQSLLRYRKKIPEIVRIGGLHNTNVHGTFIAVIILSALKHYINTVKLLIKAGSSIEAGATL